MLDRIILRPSDAPPRLLRDERRSLTLAGALFLAACMAPAEEDEAATSSATASAAFGSRF